MLQYIVEKSLNENKDEQLIVTTLDFKKAFDSIKRKELIETLIKYKINPKIIDIVAKLYKNDETVIKMGDREETIKIGSGIKQGCTASTEFFKLVTYEIIKELEEKGEKFTIGDICINSIFFADDSIALAKTINATRKNLKIIKEVSKKFGLIVNEEKSKILIFKKRGNRKREIDENKEEEIKEIEGIEVVKSMKYLGVEINDGIDIFKKQKLKMKEKAETIAKNTYAVIEKCCNKILIGKTFWKGVALPSILMGNQAANFSQTQINQLQTIENGVYRKILGGAHNTVLETIRGDIGASLMESRIMENKILLVKNIMEGSNELMKEILSNMRKDEDIAKMKNKEKERQAALKQNETTKKRKIERTKGNKWMEKLDQYLNKLNIEYKDIEEKDKSEIKRITKEYDDEKWKEELSKKPTAKMYFRRKKEIGQEKIYDNRYSSVLLFRARSNSLRLNDEQRHRKGTKDTSCKMCGAEYEDLTHFMIKCRELEKVRNVQLMTKKKGANDEDTVENLLFDIEKTDLEETKKMIQRMWNKRNKIEKKLKKENKKEDKPNGKRKVNKKCSVAK